MAASIVAPNHDIACQQGAQCDNHCQTVAAFDQNEAQCHISVGFYSLQSTQSAAGCCGMDAYRMRTERGKEHLLSIRDSKYTDDKKYAFMSRHGGPGACIIQLHPKHLHMEQWHRRNMVKKGRPVNSKRGVRAAQLPRASWNHRGETPVRLQLMHGSGSTPDVLATDLALAFSTAATILFHSSIYQLANRVAIHQTLGKSEVCCLYSAYSDAGDQTIGSLLSALRWESHRQGWFAIQYYFIHKV